MNRPSRLHLQDLHEAAFSLFGDDCDMPTIYAVIGAAVGHRIGYDSPWLNVIGGASGGKTERIWPLSVAENVTPASNISSEGALLSATSAKERTDNASGGLLREIGTDGILLIKDVTSILSMSGDRRQSVLAALREVYDGEWTRKVGTDGGATYTWEGHCTVIGAVTEIWDSYHSVIAQMGDRFLLIRLPAETVQSRKEKAKKAALLRGSKRQRKKAYENALLAVVENADLEGSEPTEDEADTLVDIADQTTRLRTPAETDWRGYAVAAPTPEGIYRFLGQLQSLFQGMVAAGIDRGIAMDVCRKVGHDSVPPRRMKILQYLDAMPHSKKNRVSVGTGIPATTCDRDMDEMRMQGFLALDENLYSLSDDVDLSCYVQKFPIFCSTPSKGSTQSSKASSSINYVGVAENGESKPQVRPYAAQETDSGSDDDGFNAMLEAIDVEGPF